MKKQEEAGGKRRWFALLFMVTLVFWFVWMGRTRMKTAPTE
jgi:hypothetical protein